MKLKFTAIVTTAILATACGNAGDASIDANRSAEFGSQGLYLRSEIPASADVDGMLFEFIPVSCESGEPTGEPVISVERELEPFKIPGGIGELEDNPLDADSEHYFADAFETLPVGCYDVATTPIQESSEASLLCRPALERNVEVLEGTTTEVFLINQCGGSDPGALDAITTLNHEPEILDVEFEESKFRACGSPQVVCATVTDPDKDPLEFEWELSASSPYAEGPRVVSREEDKSTGTVTECVEYLPSSTGKYDVTVRAYDQLWEDGALKRIEDWLAEQGYPSESHAALDFFFYVAKSGAAIGGGTTIGGDPESADGAAAATADSSVADILVLASTSAFGAATGEVVLAAGLGYTADLVDDATWAAMDTADFAQYKALLFADPNCRGGANATTGAVPYLAAAEANVDVWTPAVTGNVVVAGIDQAYHYNRNSGDERAKATGVIENFIKFAVDDAPKTGAFVSLSCYYGGISASAPAPVPVLAGFGEFRAFRPGSLDAGHIVADHPAMDTLTDWHVSNWSSTVHEAMSVWPSNFEVLAISPDGSGYTAGDGTVGSPFILARGVTPTSCGNGTLDPSEECDDGNLDGGDGCDSACNLEICGDGIQQSAEGCDDGNTEGGDGCSPLCQPEDCFVEVY